jgi:hypothetical protein
MSSASSCKQSCLRTEKMRVRTYVYQLDISGWLWLISAVNRSDDDIRIDFDDVIISESLRHYITNVVVAVVNEYAVLMWLLRGVCEIHLFIEICHALHYFAER